MSKLRIVHVPGLERVSGGVDALPSSWHRLLSRAHPVKIERASALGSLLGQELPSPAILARLCDIAPMDNVAKDNSAKDNSERWWLRFDAVSMRPDLSAVWVERRQSVDFSAPQFSALASELGAMFDAEGLTWNPVATMGCGLVPLPAAPDVEFQALNEVEGARLDEVLPVGADADRWRRLINESQMIFHQFRPLSAADPRGVGLWFWGGGAWPPPAAMTSVEVSSPNPDGRTHALSRWLRSDVNSQPSDWVKKHSDSARLLIAPLEQRDPSGSLEALYAEWLKPLKNATLFVAGDRLAWRINAAGRFAFWRGSRLAKWPELLA